MVRDLVDIGDKLELKKIRLRSDELENEKIYKSQLLDFIDNETASILMPIEKGKIIPLSVGDKYNLRFFTKKGLYQCKSIIIGRSRVNNIYILNIQFTSDLEKYQRRQFYRLECILDVDYYIASDAEISIFNKIRQNNFTSDEELQTYTNALNECKRQWLKGSVVDISGGGARFVSESIHEYGNILFMKIDFNNGSVIRNSTIKAMIVSSEKMMNRQGYYEHRVQFRDMPKEDRETIIKFIFEEERKQRSKGKSK